MTQEEYVQALEHTLEAAKSAIISIGHKPTCAFTACNCGAVESFCVHHVEFWRRYNDLQSKKACPLENRS